MEPGLDLNVSSPEYEAALRHGVLVLPVCTVCETWAPPWIPHCRGDHRHPVEWRPVSGRGVLQGWVTYHKPYPLPRSLGVPYTVAHVELDCAVRLNGHLQSTGAALAQGMPVDFTVVIDGGRAYPAFRLSEGK